jgi:hypothetical protein
MVVCRGLGGGAYTPTGGDGVKPSVNVAGFDELRLVLRPVPQLAAGGSYPWIDDHGPVGYFGHAQLPTPRPLRIVGGERDQPPF